jgi:hypothetical protein
MPQLPEIIYNALAFIVTGAICWAAWSLNDLNIKIAVMLERIGQHDDHLARQDGRLSQLEDDVRGLS